MKIKFIANAVKWFDRINGNTYHSVRVTRCEDGAVIYCPFQYGYGDHYRQTALEAMVEAKWIDAKYNERENGGTKLFMYERENDYPIDWNVCHGLKRECKANGEK